MLIWSLIIMMLWSTLAESATENLRAMCDGHRYGTLLPNPADCNSFYVCSFIVHLSYCDPGLHFDRRRKVCNWPKFAGCEEFENSDEFSIESGNVEEQSKEDTSTLNSEDTEENPLTTSVSIIADKITSPGPEIQYTKVEEDGSSVDPLTDSQWSASDATNSPDEESTILLTSDITSSKNPLDVPVDPHATTDKEDPDEAFTSSKESSEQSTYLSEETTTIKSESQEEISTSTEILPEKSTFETDSAPTNNEQETDNPTTEHQNGDKEESILDKSTESLDNPFIPSISDPEVGLDSNLSVSISSVASELTSITIDRPIIGGHDILSGYPVDVMINYNPENVQCIYKGFYFLPHPTDCQKYYICAYQHLHLHSCGKGVHWNYRQDQCELESTLGCYSDENMVQSEKPTPLIEDSAEVSSSEITTISSIDSTTVQISTTKTAKSTLSTTVSHHHGHPICPSTRQAYLPSLDDCNKYYICINGKPVLTSCPSFMHWDATGEFCGNPKNARCAVKK